MVEQNAATTPAIHFDANIMPKFLESSGLINAKNTPLSCSLNVMSNENFGTYRKQFVKFPRQNAQIPSSR